MVYFFTKNNIFGLFLGKIQPVAESATRPEGHGPTRGGLSLLQTHARPRPTPHPPDGNASCQEKRSSGQ